jgi:hypothetical protein
MFIVGGIMISRPGLRIGWGLESGIEPKSLALAQYAVWPRLAASAIAPVIACTTRETYRKELASHKGCGIAGHSGSGRRQGAALCALCVGS